MILILNAIAIKFNLTVSIASAVGVFGSESDEELAVGPDARLLAYYWHVYHA